LLDRKPARGGQSFHEPIRWLPGGRAAWLVGDIGATNLRFALAEPGDRASAFRRPAFTVADHVGMEAALLAYLQTIAPRSETLCAGGSGSGWATGSR
jgi:glucokinase